MIEQQHFDVYFTYHLQDESEVLNIAEQLKYYGLCPWVKAEQIKPGTYYQDITQKAIHSIKCAALFLGRKRDDDKRVDDISGERVDDLSLIRQVHMSQRVEKGKILIPVLLPGVDKTPEEMLFLKEIHGVRFANGINDRKAIEDLVWAITNQKPDKSTEQNFDVLLCYNQEDQFTVKNIANQLKEKKIRPWLDIWEVPGGIKTYKQVLKDIKRIRSVAFLIGSQCPWQTDLLESVIEEFLELGIRLIPVMLKNVPPEPTLPVYLKYRTRVDFCDEESDPLWQLISAIRNLKK